MSRFGIGIQLRLRVAIELQPVFELSFASCEPPDLGFLFHHWHRINDDRLSGRADEHIFIVEIVDLDPDRTVDIVVFAGGVDRAKGLKSEALHQFVNFALRGSSLANNMGLRNQWKEQTAVVDKPHQAKRSLWEEPIVQGQTMEILEPVPVVAEVIPFEPALQGLVVINLVFGFSLASLLLPFPGEIGGIQKKMSRGCPSPEGILLKWANNAVYREVACSAVGCSGLRRELPRLIRLYCLMASSSDAFGCCDNCSFNRMPRCRWKSFR